MNTPKIDLHTHTTCSDGKDSPAELVNNAMAAGITILGLTDHDSTAGWEEAAEHLRPGMDLVPGAEISCQNDAGLSVHMLGMLFDPTHEELVSVLERTREHRHGRMELIIARLTSAGFEITMEEVLAQKTGDATLGRPHLADALVHKKYFKNRSEVFTELLHNGSPYYVPHYSPKPAETIRLIKEAGGVSVVAHPLASAKGRTLQSSELIAMVEAGLDGLEIDHRDHDGQEREKLRAIAKDYNLIMTGSSDYHGSGKENRLGENLTAPEQWEALEARATERRVISA